MCVLCLCVCACVCSCRCDGMIKGVYVHVSEIHTPNGDQWSNQNRSYSSYTLHIIFWDVELNDWVAHWPALSIFLLPSILPWATLPCFCYIVLGISWFFRLILQSVYQLNHLSRHMFDFVICLGLEFYYSNKYWVAYVSKSSWHRLKVPKSSCCHRRTHNLLRPMSLAYSNMTQVRKSIHRTKTMI